MVKSPTRTPMVVATTFEMDSGSPESRNKPFHLCPGNYSGSRQSIIAVCFILVMVTIAVQILVNKGNDDGKKKEKVE